MTGLDVGGVTQLHALGLLAPGVARPRDRLHRIRRARRHARRRASSSAASTYDCSVRFDASPNARSGLIDDLSAPLRSKGSGLSGDQARGVTVDLAAEVGALRSVLYERALQDYLGH